MSTWSLTDQHNINEANFSPGRSSFELLWTPQALAVNSSVYVDFWHGAIKQDDAHDVNSVHMCEQLPHKAGGHGVDVSPSVCPTGTSTAPSISSSQLQLASLVWLFIISLSASL